MKKLFTIVAVLVLITAFFYSTARADAVESKYKITVYGKVKLDVSMDDSAIATGNYMKWVDPETSGGPQDVGAMNITANETRLGLKFSGPDYDDLVTTGVLEIDFYQAAAENKAIPYMRHAFVSVKWPDIDLSLLGGQTWDVIAPLNPSTLNYSVMWWQGNIQYRRPQIRVTKGIDASDDVKVKLELALARNIGDTSGTYTTLDSGTDNESPIIEYRAGVTFPGLAEKKMTIGLSGATGSQTRYTNATATTSKDYDVEVMALDFDVPLMEQLTLKAEYWTGKNVASFLGLGSVATVGGVTDSVEEDGYWAALNWKFAEYWQLNVGYGVDDPDDDDIAAASIAENSVIYGNVIYALSEAVSVGLEVANMETEYKGTTTKADNTRIQGSMIYTF